MICAVNTTFKFKAALFVSYELRSIQRLFFATKYCNRLLQIKATHKTLWSNVSINTFAAFIQSKSYASTNLRKFSMGCAPMVLRTALPSSNKTRVGTALMPKFAATSGQVSTSTE